MFHSVKPSLALDAVAFARADVRRVQDAAAAACFEDGVFHSFRVYGLGLADPRARDAGMRCYHCAVVPLEDAVAAACFVHAALHSFLVSGSRSRHGQDAGVNCFHAGVPLGAVGLRASVSGA
mmetsp:Transcript_26293/g.61132  ORF Transcript_26293/g.61132 Transcript_26293/m.61132 type:complete len:122 (+) Transcript_26293:867-1232(+)